MVAFVFERGRVVTMREVHRGEVWAVRPMRIVRDDEDGVVLWMPVGTPWWKPVTLDGGPWRVPEAPWRLVEDVWHTFDLLHVIEADGDSYAPYAIWHGWRDGVFSGWYVNLQSPLQRTPDGFDYLDHALDLVLAPDVTHRWKDEDELEAYVARGVLSKAEADDVRSAGAGVLARAQRREAPFDGTWRGFRPDPSWVLPERPEVHHLD